MTITTPSQHMHKSTAYLATEKASRYLQQLCKHFAHKIPVSFDAANGRISFPGGDCDLEANENQLTLSVTAPDAEALAQLQDVVVRHLERFAFRESVQLEWSSV